MPDRKELIKKYKQTIQPMGILQIKNTSNGKIFLIKSKNLPGTLNSTRFQLRIGSFNNQQLQADFKQLGENNFTFEILDQLKPKEDPLFDYSADLEILETLWLEKLQPYNPQGYHQKL